MACNKIFFCHTIVLLISFVSEVLAYVDFFGQALGEK